VAALQTIELLGLLGAASYGLARLARASRCVAWHRYALVVQPRTRLPAMPRGYAVQELSAAALSEWGIDASPAVQAERFEAGLACLGAFDPRGALTGLVWLGTEAYDEDEVAVRFLLPADCCWDTGLWIAPEHRMGRTFAALWAGVATWMDEHGLTCSLSRISDYNRTALRAHLRMQARVLAHCTFVRFGNWQWSAAARPRLVQLRATQDKARAVLDLRGLDLTGGVQAQAGSVSAS
jgi:hypothetical protein